VNQPPHIEDHVDRVLREWRQVEPSLDVSPVGVIARLARVRAHIDRVLEVNFARFGLSGATFTVLATLRRQGEPFELGQRELGERVSLTPGTVSVRVDGLVEKGLVERIPDPTDARGVRVRLTDLGRQRVEACSPSHLATEERLLSALTVAERDQLAGLLRTLLLSFEPPADTTCVTGRLGLALAPAHVARELRAGVGLPDEPGLLVREVTPGGPAAVAGLRVGDLVVGAADRPVRSILDLEAAERGEAPLALEVVRGTQRTRLAIGSP
jgi:DNA-binding MarR family transcriptional regulator